MAILIERTDRPERPWTVRWREGGKHRRRSFRLKSEAKAFRSQVEAIELAARRGEAPPVKTDEGKRMRVSELADRWLSLRLEQGLSDGQLGKDRAGLRWLRQHVGSMSVGVFARDGKKYVGEVLDAVTAAGRGASTRVIVYQAACAMMDYAWTERLIADHSCREAKPGTAKREREIKPFTHEEFTALVSVMEPRDALIARLMYDLGLRPQEAGALVVEQFKQRPDGRMSVTINRAVKGDRRKVYVKGMPPGIGRTKTGETRTLTLPAELAETVRAWMQNLTIKSFLFTNREGGIYWDSDNWRKRVWAEAVKRAGLQDRIPYDLRHTCASRLIARGADVIAVSKWMGHTPKMTMDVYGHLFPGRMDELADLLS